MKKTFFFITSVLLSAMGCQKENAVAPAAAPIANTAPVAIAGADRTIQTAQPKRTATYLNGQVIERKNYIASFKWEKISGPESGTINRPNELSTRVDSLDFGVYHFRLTVADTKGLIGSDTIQITVEKSNTAIINNDKDGEILISNLMWIYPWGASLEIKDIKLLVPANKPFKVFVQRTSNTEWVNVPLSDIYTSADSTLQYEYFVETRPDGAGMYSYGALYIFYYGKDLSEPVTVKITY